MGQDSKEKQSSDSKGEVPHIKDLERTIEDCSKWIGSQQDTSSILTKLEHVDQAVSAQQATLCLKVLRHCIVKCRRIIMQRTLFLAAS